MKVNLELNFGKIQAPPNLLEIAQSVVETGFEKIAELRGYFCPEVLDQVLKDLNSQQQSFAFRSKIRDTARNLYTEDVEPLAMSFAP
ncbi:hypothetical protein [Thermosynechococcus sp. PKX82]|uniref:hypothetical protein n=1 Tax=Thermosynechococcus sp. PKX82 TaxID=3074086 RepID=UPI002872FA9B|nr:hypothetical protein [Thermosynechococcus sp. PKX82]WNC31196.1 hypothetical protein RHH53_06475 [Thermosynechococcus sp. PKX82]